jgi:F0F1-type ATP synthase delta subunit
MYAKALTKALKDKPSEGVAIAKRFLAIIQRNGDLPGAGKALEEAERLMLARAGGRKVTVESARPLSKKDTEALEKLFQSEDRLEATVNPGLVAGVRIKVGDEWIIDASLRRKIEKLFL